ncbi:LexA regulated protein [Actinobacillus porcinus]|uniref:LexA regulated protein n=1 Tax=Actinobacillus porcinus TaxID=51048 RepID=UPI0023535FAF|nr:LexA regulated protein [Actinobacillus porcinus]MCI5763826.1 LexA regulated protein [Actinobacillus porcinus]MDY5421126.1 LexA regulated protein [Actinobacillus porcinus]
MAKQDLDCITLDLFADERRVGRPKSNPLSRKQQIRINKRNQLRRDRACGLKRIELKLHTHLVRQLEERAIRQGLSRAELIENILQTHLNIQSK